MKVANHATVVGLIWTYNILSLVTEFPSSIDLVRRLVHLSSGHPTKGSPQSGAVYPVAPVASQNAIGVTPRMAPACDQVSEVLAMLGCPTLAHAPNFCGSWLSTWCCGLNEICTAWLTRI